MKIIFDNEEQKDELYYLILKAISNHYEKCPRYYDLYECGCDLDISCDLCWENAIKGDAKE